MVASGRRAGDACASGTRRLAFLLRRIGREKLGCDFASDTADRLVVGVPEAECVAAPGHLHAMSTRPPLQRLNAMLAITFFDTRTLAPIAMSAILARGTYRFDHLEPV